MPTLAEHVLLRSRVHSLPSFTTRRRRPPRRAFCAKLALTLALLPKPVPSVSAQEMAVPVAVQMSVFFRVLEYDRDLANRVGDELVIGIAYQRRNRASLNARDEVLVASQGETSVMGIRISYVELPVPDDDSFADSVQAYGVDVLYISPLRSVRVEDVIAAAAEQGALTWTGVVEYCERGAAVAIGVRGGRAEIVINLDAARAVGARFGAQLLKLARLVGGDPGPAD